MEARTTIDVNGQEVELEKTVSDIASLRKWIRELNLESNNEPAGDDEEGEPGAVKPPTPILDRPWGQMDLSEELGKKGESVTVKLTGMTDVPVQGFIAAIGYESNAMAVESVDFGDFLTSNAREATEMHLDRPRGHRASGNAGANLLLYSGGWSMSIPADTDPTGVDPAELDDVEGAISPAILIPPMTVLARITFKLDPQIAKGRHRLLLWTNKFGKPKTRILFTSMENKGIDPDTEDGSITVVE